MTPPEPKDGDGYEYKPDFEENPSLEVPPQPPAVYDPDDPDGLDTDDFDNDEDLREGYEGPYDSDKDEGGGSMKRLQIGCGVFILLGLAMAIVVPVFANFGGDDGPSSGSATQGNAACILFLDTAESFLGEVPDDEEFMDRFEEIVEAATVAESPIRDSSVALSAAAAALVAASSDAEEIGIVQEFNIQMNNFGEACVDAGYLSRR